MDRIIFLGPCEIFVFGSNEAGIHGAGAAKCAVEKFGAKMRQGYGLQGRSFAIPTKDKSLRTLPLQSIAVYIDRFIEFARLNPQLSFLMTKIGTGLAGYSIDEMRELFIVRQFPSNVILPSEFQL